MDSYPALRTAVRTTAFVVEELKRELNSCKFENKIITQNLNDLSSRMSRNVEDFQDGFGSVSDDGVQMKDVIDASKWRNQDLMDVTGIVNAVVSGEIKKQTVTINDDIPEEQRKYLEFDSGDDENFVDPEQPLKDSMTDLVTSQFLRHNAANKRFLTVVINIFNDAMESYKQEFKRETGITMEEKDLVFMYMVGNVLRVIYHTYLNEQPRSVTELVNDTFADYFKKSDADFQIYINPSIAHYERVYEDIQLLSYLLLVRIRHIYKINPYLTLNFDKLKEEFQKNILDKLVTDVNDLEILGSGYKLKDGDSGPYAGSKLVNLVYGDIETGEIPEHVTLVDDTRLRANFETYTRDKGSSRPDIAVVRHPSKNYTAIYKLAYMNRLKSAERLGLIDKEIQEGVYGDADRDQLYISWNNSIDILKRGKFQLKFALVRMKINMKGFFKFPDGRYGCLNMGGEFIDVSIPHKDATETKPFYENYEDYVQKLKIDVSSNDKLYPGKIVTYNSYTLRYFIKDLHKMLYDEPIFPWMANKYEKRLFRTGILSMLDTLYVIIDQDSNFDARDTYSSKLDKYANSIEEYKNVLHDIANSGENKLYDISTYKNSLRVNRGLDVNNMTDSEILRNIFAYNNASGTISFTYHNAYQLCRIADLIENGALQRENIDKMKEYIGTLINVQDSILKIIRAKKKYIEDGNLGPNTLQSYRSIIQAGQHGGGNDPYFQKYMKYKNKYLQIKD